MSLPRPTAGLAQFGNRFRTAGIAALVAVALVGCSQGERKRLADDVAGAANRTPVLTGTYVASLRPKKLPSGVQLQTPRGATFAALGVSVDHAKRRAALSQAGTDALVLYDPATIYVRRITRSAADKRLWSRLELHKLADEEISVPKFRELAQGAGPGDIAAVDPVFLLDLLRGALTGSLKVTKTNRDGSRVITFNTSISKAQRKLRFKEHVKKERKQMLRSLAITSDFHKGDVVLRKDGTLAAAHFILAERPDKSTELDLDLQLTFIPSSQRIDLSIPQKTTTVRVAEFGTIKGAIADRLLPARAPASPA